MLLTAALEIRSPSERLSTRPLRVNFGLFVRLLCATLLRGKVGSFMRVFTHISKPTVSILISFVFSSCVIDEFEDIKSISFRCLVMLYYMIIARGSGVGKLSLLYALLKEYATREREYTLEIQHSDPRCSGLYKYSSSQ